MHLQWANISTLYAKASVQSRFFCSTSPSYYTCVLVQLSVHPAAFQHTDHSEFHLLFERITILPVSQFYAKGDEENTHSAHFPAKKLVPYTSIWKACTPKQVQKQLSLLTTPSPIPTSPLISLMSPSALFTNLKENLAPPELILAYWYLPIGACLRNNIFSFNNMKRQAGTNYFLCDFKHLRIF